MPISSTKFNIEDLASASSVTSNDLIEIRKYDSVNDSYESQKVSAAQVGKTYYEGHGIEIDSNNNINATTVGNSTYSTSPIKTGGVWIDNNDIYKITINCGTLPNADTITIAHTISGMSKIVKWEAIATNSTIYIDFSNLVESIDSTNITITTTEDMSSYTGYVTIYYTLKKAFDRVLYTTDDGGIQDGSYYQFYADNGYNYRIWLYNSSDRVWLGVYGSSSGGLNNYTIVALSESVTTVHDRMRRLGGGTQTGLSDVVINNNYNNKGYYKDIGSSVRGQHMGIETIFSNRNDLLTAFFD